MSLTEDPRWIEYNAACQAVRDGLFDGRERRDAAEFAYCEALAEECATYSPQMRKFQMVAVATPAELADWPEDPGYCIGLDKVLVAFRATDDEVAYVKDALA